MAQSKSAISDQPAYIWGSFSLFAATAVILTALGFEHFGGYQPCPLCLQQRYAYYIAIPALFGGLILVGLERDRPAAILFALIATGFLLNAGLATYHAGVEWGFWQGPATCDGQAIQPLSSSGTSLVEELSSTSFASCGEATWRFIGLSFAGWNAIACIALAMGCAKAAAAASASNAP
ncbi:MAG: disulfide bond formation protein B [Hyphomicrobiaceae bacterium]